VSKENYSLENALIKYIQLLDTKDYFDAHEVLEEAWHPLRKSKHPLANLVKGFINASIALEHLKRDTPTAKNKVTRVIASYQRHIYLCREDIEHYELFREASKKIEIPLRQFL